MDALCAAVPLARTLLRLAERGGARSVVIEAAGRRATLILRERSLVHAHGVDVPLLGDTLVAWGALNQARHRAGLERGDVPSDRVGQWLVEIGAASAVDVERALAQQLERAVERLLRTRGAHVSLVSTHASVRHSETVRADLSSAVVRGLLAIARELPAHTLRARAGTGVRVPTRWGALLLPRVTDVIDEETLVTVCRDACGEPAAPERATLCALGVLSSMSVEPESYGLLLRKRREIRQRLSASQLLDLPEGASGMQARAALRQLARKLHPDRFQAREPALLALAVEVMSALCVAEAALSSRERAGACG